MAKELAASRGTEIPLAEAGNKGRLTTSLRCFQLHPLGTAAPPAIFLMPGVHRSAKQGLH